jgi:hypothetical protein
VTSGFFLQAALRPENNLLENILTILKWSVYQMQALQKIEGLKSGSVINAIQII